jgi:Bacterial Ig domain
VTINNLPPSAVLTSPPNGTVVTAPALVTLAADAADPDGTIVRVEFFAGAAKVGESTAAPYSATWTASVPGSYLLTARATDESGASATSAPAGVLVNAPPSASLTSPAPDAVFAAPASITLSATAGDADGQVVRVDFYQGVTLLGSAAAAPYTWTVANVPAGAYAFTATAIDDRGAAASSPAVSVKVESHRAPAADAYVRDGSSNAGRNFGTATTLVVKKGSSKLNRWSYLRFDTSVLPSVSQVRLRLFGRLNETTSTVVTTSVYPVANTTWGETQITWNNKPASGATRLASAVLDNQTTTERWYEWDVTAYVQQEKAAGRHVVTLVLKNDENSSPYDTFRSREATSQRPELVLTP